jgi:hypothetical protein
MKYMSVDVKKKTPQLARASIMGYYGTGESWLM